MQENTDKESKEVESTEEETTVIFVPDNPQANMTGITGTIYVPNEEEFGCPSLVEWAKDLPRDEPVDEEIGLYLSDDELTIAAGPALEISVPLSMIEELIAAYRDETRRRIVTG